MGEYNPAKHSKNKLGIAVHAVVIPDLPVGAQVSLESGIFHIMLPGGVYVAVYKPIACLLPEDFQGAQSALPTLPDEPTYSGSGSPYKRLAIELGIGVAEGHYTGAGPAAYIRAGEGGPVLVRVYVDPTCPVASTDEDPLTGATLPSGLAKLGSGSIPGISIPDDEGPKPQGEDSDNADPAPQA
jgi:hypothetical protein